jgi:uncharacterized protein with HEPN domain
MEEASRTARAQTGTPPPESARSYSCRSGSARLSLQPRDCLAEIAILHEIAARMTLQTFRNDPIMRRAAAYAIQTISEAVRHIPDDWLAAFPTEPWAQIRGVGNRIRHECFRIDDAILSEIVTTDTRALKSALEAMLARHARDSTS